MTSLVSSLTRLLPIRSSLFFRLTSMRVFATVASRSRSFRRSRDTMMRLAVAVVATTVLTACHGLLDVSDPTLVRDSDIANPAGANARRLDVVQYLNNTASQLAIDGAVLTDEITIDYIFTTSPSYLDKRDSQGYEAAAKTTDVHLGLWDQVYYQSTIAINAVRAYSPDSVRSEYLGQLYAIRGYAALQVAEDMCPGFPLNDVTADNGTKFSGPLTTDSAVSIASAALDSAVTYAHDSTRFVVLARVAKGRALLDQGKYAEAAAVVASVPTDSTYLTDGPYNYLNSYTRPARRWFSDDLHYAVMDHEGTNGLAWVSEHDPRVGTVRGGPRWTDSTDTLFKTNKYPSSTTAFVLASGVEARLIEAEAALNAGDPNWLTILNTLRANSVTPAVPPLVDPVTPSARVDLLYHERAFWLYLTGRRLGDLRRLIKNYGRTAESVFPTGAYSAGGTFGSATAIPFILAGQQLSNPYIAAGCTTR